MFYDIRVMNSKRIGAVWRAATYQETDIRDVHLPKVCSRITKWMDYEDDSRRRLSLRASSLLVNGSVRILKAQLNSLYDDCVQLTEDLYQETNSDEHSSTKSSRLQRSSRNSSTSSHRSKIRRNIVPQNPDVVDESQNITSKTYTIESNVSSDRYIRNSRIKNKLDKEVQTLKSFIANKRRSDKEKMESDCSLDDNASMGITMVYDRKSRVPTKIILSSINKRVIPP